MDKTIDKIASLAATKLNAAKQEIANGRQEIQKYVAGLEPSLRQVGQEAAQNIQSKFNELEQSVDNKESELIDSLAQKYNDNLKQLDSRIDEMKAENRGLVDKAKDAIAETIKTIMQLKDMLMGVLSKAAGAIDKIIKDPVGFLGNLISGIKQGFQNFASNISQHLKKGMLAFLTGALAGAGITMPENFDLKGIFSLVMQVLGVVYDAIKSRVIKAFGKNGEKMFTALESSFEMFVILKNEGVAGLWQFIQDKIGDLKAMVIDTIQTFVVESVIKAGVMWVLSLLNPASAFVRACKAIYDIIMFLIERGSQIAELVSAVTESVAAIASGAVGGAAKLIENALERALPVVIGFMASLLGLGGISEKIEGIIKKVRAPIDKAIDWLIAQAVKFAKKIGNKLGFGKDKKGNKDEDPEHEQKVKEGLAQLHQEEAKHVQNGAIAQEDANKVAAKVKSDNPVFKSITVVDGGNKWKYEYVASPKEDEPSQYEKKEDEVKGAFALYRGIHFKKNWNKEDYDAQLERNLVGEPTFSAAAREIADSQKPDGSDVSKADLEAAAKLVREKVELTKDPKSVRQWWNKKQQIFDSLFLAMLQDYLNRYGQFEAELKKAQNGQYNSLEFISIPFISTSKKGAHAASYALGEKGTLKDNQRTTGTVVGRLFVYLFTAKELVEQGAVDIQELQKSGNVKIKARILKEGEVTFTGSIPGENLIAQHDAKPGDSAQGLGATVEQTAQQIAQNQGGLREWES